MDRALPAISAGLRSARTLLGRRPMRATLLALSVLAALLAGCEGALEGGPARPAGSPEPAPVEPGECRPGAAVFAPMRRLTRAEIERTLRDLVGDPAPTGVALPAEGAVAGTRFALAGGVSQLFVESQLEAAEIVAARAIAAPAAILPCTTEDDACAEQFVRTFGRRAWRRPLTDAEVERAMAIHRAGSDQGFLGGIELVITALLAAPEHLYHLEAEEGDVAGTTREVRGYALASRLSYFLWGSMPDDALLDAAGAGRLETADDAEREARRMLEDPRAREAVSEFFASWLEIDRISGIARDPELYPDATPEVRADLARSMEAFVDWAFWEEGTYDALYRSDVVFVNDRIAPIYAPGAAVGPDLEPVSLPDQRLGLVTQPGFLALRSITDSSSPIQRGVFVIRDVLCQTLAPPPGDVDTNVPPPEPGLSTRDRFAAHTADPTCASCHARIDPIGFSLERFDAIGAHRETEGGAPIDDSGVLLGTRDVDGPVDGALDLASRIAESSETRACFVTQWARFAVRRPMDPGDRCAIAEIERALEESGGDLHEMMVALARSAVVRERRVADDVPGSAGGSP